jgi:hypothetical protein
LGPDPSKSFWRLALAIPISIVLHFVVSLVLFEQAAGASFVVRAALSVIVVAPPAFFMGMAFPSAIRELGRIQPELIPWGWALNGSFSVVGSSLAVLGAMILGFRAMILWTAAIYFVAIVSFAMWRKRVATR